MKQLMVVLGVLLTVVTELGAQSEAPVWNIDRTHSTIEFSVRHFFTPVSGSFADYDIDLVYDPAAPEEATVTATIAVASVSTNHQKRDSDLQGEQFFDRANHPAIEFTSDSVTVLADDEFIVHGSLAIKGTSLPVDLAVKRLGIMDLPESQRRRGRVLAGFEAGLTIDRRDFQVGTGSWAETTVLGSEVEIMIALEARLP